MRDAMVTFALAGALVLAAAGVGAGERVVVELVDGSKVEGELLKKDPEFVHLSVADQVLSLAREKIEAISGELQEEEAVEDFGLYRTWKGSVKSVAAHAEQLGDAIVVVRTPSGMGTGWFCNPEGYIVTNQHVIANEQSISVTVFKREGSRFEKKVFKKVKLVALDPDLDLALLRIEEEMGLEIPQLYIGDSTALGEGDEVFTIGNPMGLERSTAQGIISKINRNMGGRLYIQTTAPIAPGNSGGPLFNERGEVVGVVNMGYVYLDGLGFAIPSKYVKEFLDNLEAFAFDPDNPNAGMRYMEPPVTATDGSIKFTAAEFVKVGAGLSCLTLADVDGDGVEEVLFANNNKGEIGILRRRREGEVEEQTVDFEDINRLPDSERFRLVTHAVNNKITSIAVADQNDDGRPDIIFYGDVDGLSFVEQREDGSFGTPCRIEDVKLNARTDALQILDLDGDGEREIFALGTTEIHVLKKGEDPRAFPLDARFRDRIKQFELVDVNGDGRLDIVLFASDMFYAAEVLIQDAEGRFVNAELVRSHVSGPVRLYRGWGPGIAFLTLDKGHNRIREMRLQREEQPAEQGRINTAVGAVALSAEPGADAFELGDLDGDGRPEIVTTNEGENEFLVVRLKQDGFEVIRSPSPKKVSDLALFGLEDGRTALFSLSRDDKIFGVSGVGPEGVTFPRPINTESLPEFIGIEQLEAGTPSLVWVEKVGQHYAVRTADVAALARQALDGQTGSIDVEAQSLSFGEDEQGLKDTLPRKPLRLAFADFNRDGTMDLVVYWSYSGRESLYLGRGEGRFTSVIADQEFLEEQKDQPLLVADVNGDGLDDVLLVQPGFVRTLAVDDKNKLYVERQFNWEFEPVSRLVPYPAEGAPRFLALTGSLARIVELDAEAGQFDLIAAIDLTGLSVDALKLADADGNGTTDVLLLDGNALRVVYDSSQRRALQTRIVFDARMDYFTYWNIHAADLDGDEKDEVMAFDSKKAVFEIHRRQPDGMLRPVCRNRLFERTIYQRGEADSYELPQEVAVGDMDGNGKADLVLILQDRIAIYLQDAAPL